MKRVLLLAAMAAIALGVGTQMAAGQRNSNYMSIRVAGYEVLLEPDGELRRPDRLYPQPKRYKGHIGTWELGFNGFRQEPGAYSMYPAGEKGFLDLNMGKSFHITANLSTMSASLSRNNVFGITMGIGLTINDFVFDTPSAFTKADRMLRPVDAERNLKKAKLNTVAIHIPLALEVSPTRNFFFSVGGYADLTLGSHMKWKPRKEKLRDPYTNFLQAGVTARIGFHRMYVFGNFALTEMFKKGQGPALTPYTFGIGCGL